MPRPILLGDYTTEAGYRLALLNAPMLWKISEPVDTKEILAHAAKIPLAELEVIMLPCSNGNRLLECAVLHPSAMYEA